MRSTFAGLNMAFRALMAQQLAVDVTNHNVGNANTEGYSRQSVNMVASMPYTAPTFNRVGLVGQIGTGVQVAAIQRFRSMFHDLQFRFESQALGQWEARRDAIREVERIFAEPTNTGLGAMLGQFWNAWRELANAPENLAFRQQLKQTTVLLTDQFQHTHRQLVALREGLDAQIEFHVVEINSLASRVAALNDQIQKVVATGDHPNDLRDQRDRLLDELSRLVNLSYRELADGTIQVMVGGHPLVFGSTAYELITEPDPANQGLVAVRWALDGSRANVTNGKLFGALTSRDSLVTPKIDELNRLAVSLANAVNERHRQGITLEGEFGEDFFWFGEDGIASAATIAMAPGVHDDLRAIAAALAPGWASDDEARPGDGRHALAIADLQSSRIAELEQMSLEKFYSRTITDLGVRGQQADAMTENQLLLLKHINEQRQIASGVSLDEEASNLIRYQRAYEAAARLITVFDQMLDRIINGMGIVGR